MLSCVACSSWGTGWGEEGYIRIQRFGDGKEPCLTDKNPADGTGCTGGPKTQQVRHLPATAH